MVWLIILIIALVIIIAYVKAIIKLSRIIKNKRGKKQKIAIGALLLLILVPFGDIPLDLYRFNKLCNEEAGIFIYQKVGLPEEFFYARGEKIEKYFATKGGYSLRTVPAEGHEIKFERLKQYSRIRIGYEKSFFDWSEDAFRHKTTVWDGDTLLGESTWFKSGFGWFFEAINPGQGPIGCECPLPSKIERTVIRDLFMYDIFYKTDKEAL